MISDINTMKLLLQRNETTSTSEEALEECYIEAEELAELHAKLGKVKSGEMSKEDLSDSDQVLIRKEITKLELLKAIC